MSALTDELSDCRLALEPSPFSTISGRYPSFMVVSIGFDTASTIETISSRNFQDLDLDVNQDGTLATIKTYGGVDSSP
jgi:hypothetical protein